MTYSPVVFQREDGSQVLVSTWTDDEGKLAGRLQVAERPNSYATWGPPLRPVIATPPLTRTVADVAAVVLEVTL